MKNFIVILLLSLLRDGVFGADEMKKEETEGDSLTLPTGRTEIKSSDQILWLYGPDQTIIAKIDGGNYIINDDDDDERFKGNLELDKQTGSLIIKNIKIKNSGLYQLVINRATTPRKFSVTVYARLTTPAIESPQCSPTPVGSSSRKCVFLCSVQTSEQATLSWYRGNSLVSSKITESCSSISLPLEANYEDKSIYSCIVNNPISNKTQHLNIAQLCQPCPDPGLSSGAVVGIVVVVVVVGVLLVFSAAGVFYYWYKISEVERQKSLIEPETVECEEGTFAVLPSGVNLVTKGDQMLWFSEYGESPIATMSKNDKKTYFYDNQRFRGRLQLDPKTGSLIIRNLRKTDSGLYHLEFKSRGGTTYRKYKVTLSGEVQTVTVKEGKDVTLKSGFPVQSVSHIMWSFEEENGFIASLITQDNKTYKPEYSDKRFKDRLELDTQTGSLTIRNIRPEHTGLYKVKTDLSAFGIKAFSVVFDDSTETRVNESVNTGFMGRIQRWCGPARNTGLFRDETDEMKTEQLVEEGDLCLNPETEIQTDDEMILRFGTSFRTRHPYVTIARFSKTGDEFKSSERFKDRLQLDHTGPLTIIIKNFKITDYGDYYVQITSKKNKSFKSFTFIVVPRGDAVKVMSVVMGKPVCLKTDITDLHKDDQMLWTFGPHGMIIKNTTTSKCDSRFKDRVDLDPKTRYLTIKNITTADSGLYELQIISGNRVIYQSFNVTVKENTEDEASASVQITDDSDQDEGNRIRAFWDERDEQEAQEATQFL